MAKTPTKKAAKPAAKKAATQKVAVEKAAPAQPAAAKKTATKKVAVKKVATKKVAAKKTAAQKVVAKKVAAPKSAAPKAITTIVAKVDVGFGSSLYLRGAGAGLSWEKGVLMGCADSDEWVWSSDAVEGEIEFKVLINDETWAFGSNAFVSAGERIVIEPHF